jgi:hypothetical protein
MFKIAQKPSYTALVNVELPGNQGKGKTVQFTAEFKRLSQTAIESVHERANAGELSDSQLLDEVLLGWDGVQDEDGNALEFNDDNLATVLDIFPTRPSIVRAFFASLKGAKEKN